MLAEVPLAGQSFLAPEKCGVGGTGCCRDDAAATEIGRRLSVGDGAAVDHASAVMGGRDGRGFTDHLLRQVRKRRVSAPSMTAGQARRAAVRDERRVYFS
jgi:hypothetical protein